MIDLRSVMRDPLITRNTRPVLWGESNCNACPGQLGPEGGLSTIWRDEIIHSMRLLN